MKRITMYILLLLAAIWGCTEQIEVDLEDSASRLVVEGSITTDFALHAVRLTRTVTYFSNQPPETVSGALVTIRDTANTYPLSEVSSGSYRMNQAISGVPGTTYTLTIELEGETYTASSVMPAIPTIDSIGFNPDPEDNKRVQIKLYAQEPPGKGDHYYWAVYKEYILATTNITQLNFANDDLINGNYLNGLVVQTVKARLGNRITLEMAAITEEYYRYCLAVIKETAYAGGPFESAPATIRGNVDNGALGFFTTCALTQETRMYIGVIE